MNRAQYLMKLAQPKKPRVTITDEQILASMEEGKEYSIYTFETKCGFRPNRASLDRLVRQGILTKKSVAQPSFSPDINIYYKKVQ